MRRNALKRLCDTARKAVTIAQRDYGKGILDQLTVLDAQRQADRADMLLVQSEMALTVNVVTLYKALGGGWQLTELSQASRTAIGAHK